MAVIASPGEITIDGEIRRFPGRFSGLEQWNSPCCPIIFRGGIPTFPMKSHDISFLGETPHVGARNAQRSLLDTALQVEDLSRQLEATQAPGDMGVSINGGYPELLMFYGKSKIPPFKFSTPPTL